MSSTYIVERHSRNGTRQYLRDNGTTSDIARATRLSREYAEAWARDLRRSGDIEACIHPAPAYTESTCRHDFPQVTEFNEHRALRCRLCGASGDV